jgi:murein DD-endopeptidase MepM/ murein hydrolase activator NlpD
VRWYMPIKVPDPPGESPLPLRPHPGAYGTRRKYHTHEGVDLYCPAETPVSAVEEGVVVAVVPFTGPGATPPSPWWQDTEAVLVEGASGVVVYGEVSPAVVVGEHVARGGLVGHVLQVLTKDKGRPMSMLHLELHEHGTRDTFEWVDEKPGSLRDPTPYLLEAE